MRLEGLTREDALTVIIMHLQKEFQLHRKIMQKALQTTKNKKLRKSVK